MFRHCSFSIFETPIPIFERTPSPKNGFALPPRFMERFRAPTSGTEFENKHWTNLNTIIGKGPHCGPNFQTQNEPPKIHRFSVLCVNLFGARLLSFFFQINNVFYIFRRLPPVLPLLFFLLRPPHLNPTTGQKPSTMHNNCLTILLRFSVMINTICFSHFWGGGGVMMFIIFHTLF